MDTTTIVLIFCVMGCSTVLSQTEMTILHADTPRVLREGQGVTLNCQFNQGLELILKYKLHWHHQSLVSGDQKPTLLSSQNVLEKEEEFSANFVVDVQYEDQHTNYTLQLKDVKPKMDGRYICSAEPIGDGDPLEKSVMVIIPADVQYVQLNFDGEKVESVSDTTVERDEGEYGISCTTGGSNPAASLELFLGGDPVPATLSDPDSRDVAAEGTASARRFQRSLTVTNLKLSGRDNGKILKCVARAEIEGAMERIASIPLQIIVLEPLITCASNSTWRTGDKYVKLTCRVNHARVHVREYKFQIVSTNETITLDKDSPNYHALVVEEVLGMDDTDDVSLVLYVAKDIHFDTEIYLHVLLENGELFKHHVELREGGPSGASSRSAAYVLCLLMAVLVWSL